MQATDIIDEHIIIRETVGYDLLRNIDVCDLPNVLKFLKIVYNYQNITNKLKEL